MSVEQKERRGGTENDKSGLSAGIGKAGRCRSSYLGKSRRNEKETH